jgi:hypothetical protein
MASRKSFSVEEATEIVSNDDSGDELIPELDSSDSESEDDEPAVSGAVQGSEDMPDTSPSYRPPSSNFAAKVGLNVDNANIDDVISFVNLFITEEFFEFICDQLNLYAEQVISAVPCPFMKYSLVQTWKRVTVPELKQFLGLMFVTSIIEKPDSKMYWTVDPVFETLIFSKTMFRNSFESIMSLLHFSDSSQYENSTDILYKIRPILKKLSNKFSFSAKNSPR